MTAPMVPVVPVLITNGNGHVGVDDGAANGAAPILVLVASPEHVAKLAGQPGASRVQFATLGSVGVVDRNVLVVAIGLKPSLSQTTADEVLSGGARKVRFVRSADFSWARIAEEANRAPARERQPDGTPESAPNIEPAPAIAASEASDWEELIRLGDETIGQFPLETLPGRHERWSRPWRSPLLRRSSSSCSWPSAASRRSRLVV